MAQHFPGQGDTAFRRMPPEGNRPANNAYTATPGSVMSRSYQTSGQAQDFLGLEQELVGEPAPPQHGYAQAQHPGYGAPQQGGASWLMEHAEGDAQVVVGGEADAYEGDAGAFEVEGEYTEEAPPEANVLASWREPEVAPNGNKRLIAMAGGLVVVGMVGAAAFKLMGVSSNHLAVSPEPLAAHENPMPTAESRIAEPEIDPALGGKQPGRVSMDSNGVATPTADRSEAIVPKPKANAAADEARARFEDLRGDAPPAWFDPQGAGLSGAPGVPPVDEPSASPDYGVGMGGAPADSAAQEVAQLDTSAPAGTETDVALDEPVPDAGTIEEASHAALAQETSDGATGLDSGAPPLGDAPDSQSVASIGTRRPIGDVEPSTSNAAEPVADTAQPTEPIEIVAAGAPEAPESSGAIQDEGSPWGDEVAKSEPATFPAHRPTRAPTEPPPPALATLAPDHPGALRPDNVVIEPRVDVAIVSPGSPAVEPASSAAAPSSPGAAVTGSGALQELANARESRASTMNMNDVLAAPAQDVGNLRQASRKDLAGVWNETSVPMDLFDAPSKVVTPNVGRVRVVLKSKDLFEGKLYAIGEGSLWLDTKFGRMGLAKARVERVEPLENSDAPAPGEPGSGNIAGATRVRVKTPGGTFFGRVLSRDDRKTTLITDEGSRITMDTKDVEFLAETPKISIRSGEPKKP